MEEIQISMQEGRGRQGKAPMRLNSADLLLLRFDQISITSLVKVS